MSVTPPSIVTENVSPGLFSAAVPQPTPDGHWELGGVQYESTGTCAKPVGWEYVCPPAVPVNKASSLGFETLTGDPFTEVLGIKCDLPGHTLDEFATRVRAAFLACVETRVETAFWTGDQGNEPHLASGVYDAATNPDGVVVVAPADAPLTLTGGVAAVESYLGQNLCGRAYLHAPRGLAAFASRSMLLVDPATSRMRTPLGSRWVFGGGYAVNTGPDGVAAPAGVAWIYATGQVNLWRSDVYLNPDDLRYGFNTRSNEVEIFAEQTFALTRECLTAAVAVRIGCDC
ncbi:MAG: hypothetical protein LC792_15470 [Actinobacteria bacterium]|nr:hypothetical protein [Actinomycetota bacterium]